jgi:hypothetical protein
MESPRIKTKGENGVTVLQGLIAVREGEEYLHRNILAL